jgi:hypothetical protein
MMVLLDINESKALFFMELLKNFSFVKAKTLTNEKALLINEVKPKCKVSIKTEKELFFAGSKKSMSKHFEKYL